MSILNRILSLNSNVMKLSSILITLLTLLVVSCLARKSTATPQQIMILDNLVDSQSFVIESYWALPQFTNSLMAIQNTGLLGPGNSAGRISLIGNSNELRIHNDMISSKLPYFGEMQSVSGYNSAGGSIAFEGKPKDYKVTKNDNSSYTITFDAKSYSENFNVMIHLYPNLKSKIILNGAKRFPIRYTGIVSSNSRRL